MTDDTDPGMPALVTGHAPMFAVSIVTHAAKHCCLHLRFELVQQALCQHPVSEVVGSCMATKTASHAEVMDVSEACAGAVRYRAKRPLRRCVLLHDLGPCYSMTPAHPSASRNRLWCTTADMPADMGQNWSPLPLSTTDVHMMLLTASSQRCTPASLKGLAEDRFELG